MLLYLALVLFGELSQDFNRLVRNQDPHTSTPAIQTLIFLCNIILRNNFYYCIIMHQCEPYKVIHANDS